jgi:hypothetical protein
MTNNVREKHDDGREQQKVGMAENIPCQAPPLT